MKEALKVGVSGVRGVVGDSFTPQLAAAFAQAFGAFVGRGPVVVGRDTRTTGPMIEYAVIAGLQSVGCKPILAGVVPTPTLLILTQHLQARGGIAITASHNSVPWNALKFVERTGMFLNEIRAEELFDIYHQQDFPFVQESEIPPVGYAENPTNEHFNRVLKYVAAEQIKKRKFRVAVDCCNGVGALYSARFLSDGLGCEVFPVFDKPTGIFERDPEPLPANLGLLSKTVLERHCDVGFAQDPDGDRLAIVDDAGRPIGEDLTLAFAVEQVLKVHGRGPVAINLSTSKCVEDVAARYGCQVTRTKIGEINVCEAIFRINAVIGGENTGGVIIPAIHPCRDSYGAMAVILELMAGSGKTVSQLRADIPQYTVLKEKIPITTEKAAAVIRALRRKYQGPNLTLLDGVHVNQGKSWWHIRRSNTEQVLRITVEAKTRQEGEAIIEELRSQIATC